MLKHTSAAVLLAALVASASGSQAQGGWLRLSPAATPPSRLHHAIASAPTGNLLFGGYSSPGWLGDTWEWDGTNWTQRSPATGPTARMQHAMAYDSARNQVVLFGGTNGTGRLSDTWEWDGTNWTQRTPATSPTARYSHSMAYDSTRGRVVLFGGSNGPGWLGDTWEWDGTNWTQRSPPTSPVARMEHAMAYDNARHRVVLFGGSSSPNVYLADTWEWDGTNWTQRSPATGPTARMQHAMAYDSARGKIVLSGGYAGGRLPPDTWEWDGAQWAANPTANRPSPVAGNAMAYDTGRGRIILSCSDGFQASGGVATWEYPISSPASYSTFGSACLGSVGVPTLQSLGTSLPWLGERFTLLFNNVPPGRPIFVFTGGSNTTWYGQFPLPLDLTGAGMTGCWLLVTGGTVGLAQPTVHFVPWNLDICQCPEVLGAHFYNQGFVYDPPANAMGMTSTNGGAGVIGIR